MTIRPLRAYPTHRLLLIVARPQFERLVEPAKAAVERELEARRAEWRRAA